MDIETEQIRIAFDKYDSGKLCAMIDYALLNEHMLGNNREFAIRLSRLVKDAYNW